MESQRQIVVAEAISWLKTPFHYEACVKGAGVSCGTLMMACYAAAGLPIDWDIRRFPQQWHLHTNEELYLAEVERYTHQVDTAGPGDIVLFRLFEKHPFCHGALVIDWPRCIHAADRRSVEYLDASKGPLSVREMRFQSPW